MLKPKIPPAIPLRKDAPSDDPPPGVWGSWRNVYAGVALYLLALIVLFYAFRMAFER